MTMHATLPTPFSRAPLMGLLLGVWLGATGGPALAQGLPAQCGALRNHYGPYDYRVSRGETLDIVERAHFTPRVEALLRGETGTLGQDISYTLHAFPNHHKALIAADQLGLKEKTDKPNGVRYVLECYFQRAVIYKPDDAVARMIYARFLFRRDRAAEAKAQLEIAGSAAGVTPFTLYNIGMVLFEFKEYEQAARYARLAEQQGFPRDDLKKRLQEIRQWPAEPAAAASAPAPAETPASEAATAASAPASGAAP